jgi:hypothetical protein
LIFKEFYSKKLYEINEELVRNDEAIKSDIEKLAKIKGKLGDLEKEIKKIGFVKVVYQTGVGLVTSTITTWVTEEEYNEKFKGRFFQKRIF